MTSAIDPTKPTDHIAFTADVRQNFQFAHDEITALQNMAGTSAPLNSPVFTGDPQAPTPATADNDQSIATTAFVKAQGYLTGNQTITLSGDASGSGATLIATTITGLQGRPLAATAPTTSQVLQWNGSTWLPATVATGGGGASVTTSDTAPASPHPGDLWWDSVGGQLYVYYQDPNTSQWVAATNLPGGSLLPATAAANDQLVYVSGAWTGQRARYILGCFVPGTMTASQMLLLHRFSKAVTIPANFGAYLGHLSEARGTVNATASTVITVQQSLSGTPATFTNVGTITIAGGSMVGTFASSGGTAISFAQGDALALVGPATADTTFANLAATLVGYET